MIMPTFFALSIHRYEKPCRGYFPNPKIVLDCWNVTLRINTTFSVYVSSSLPNYLGDHNSFKSKKEWLLLLLYSPNFTDKNTRHIFMIWWVSMSKDKEENNLWYPSLSLALSRSLCLPVCLSLSLSHTLITKNGKIIRFTKVLFLKCSRIWNFDVSLWLSLSLSLSL